MGPSTSVATVSEAVIRGIEQAVAADPANAELRLHLASLLMANGRPAEALRRCREVLEQSPGDEAARALGVQAAEGAGQPDVAAELRAGPAEAVPAGGSRFGEPPPADDAEVSRPEVTLAEVAGMDDVKVQIDRMFLAPLRNPELQQAFGVVAGGGLLLWGPPGCGKTFLARALAGELGVAFVHVGIAEVLDMWLGRSERNLAAQFQRARAEAPCVIFLDELDALGHRRSRLHSDGLRTTVNQLLTEMDGAVADNDGVFVLGATNQPWDIDPALRRPGRFDRTLFVPPPDAPARWAIAAAALEDRPTVEGLDLGELVPATDGFSGADVVHAAESAVQLALEASREAGSVQPVTQAQLRVAVAGIQPSTAEWLRTARDAAAFADDGGLYEPLRAWLDRR